MIKRPSLRKKRVETINLQRWTTIGSSMYNKARVRGKFVIECGYFCNEYNEIVPMHGY
jgi:hypothetical protein